MSAPFRLVAALSLAAWGSWGTPPASAQHAPALVLEGPFTFCVLHADHAQTAYGPPVTHAHPHGPSSPGHPFLAPAPGQATATFEVTYTGFTPQAQAAFQSAVDLWAQHVASPVPIRVQATFGPLEQNVLGSAGATRIYANDPRFPRRDTWYPNALANALAREALSPEVPDIVATFNRDFPTFYFGLDGQPPVGQIDFRSVVLHEIAHGLGFFGTANVEGGVGTRGAGPPGFPVTFDRLAEDNAGVPLLNEATYPNGSAALAGLLQSNALFLNGPTLRRLNGGNRPPIYAPTPWEDGSSYSHWDEATFPAGTPNALMTPFIGARQAGRALDVYTAPGPLTCGLFREMGWPLGAGCLAAIGEQPVAAGPFGLRLAGPNPVRSGTAFLLNPGEADRVDVSVYDALGRRVATLFNGAAPAFATSLRLDVGSLPSGAYLARAEGAGEAVVVPFVVVR